MMNVLVVGGLCCVPLVGWLFETWLVRHQHRQAIEEGQRYWREVQCGEGPTGR